MESAAEIASQGAGWVGLVLAVLGIVRNELTNYNARKVAKDKQEYELVAARDKLEFDIKVLEIQKDAKHKEDELRKLNEELARCREQHDKSEKDRDDLREKIDRLEAQIAHLVAAKQ